MFFDWEDFCFSMEVANGGHFVTTCCSAQGGVLYSLDHPYVGRG